MARSASTQPLWSLDYDDLPAGSDISRVVSQQGVTITVPAGAPTNASLRAALHRAAVFGAVMGAPILAVTLVIFLYFIGKNRIAGVPLAWAVLFFTLFCAAIVALASWVRYRVIVEALTEARQQATIIVATHQRLLIETSGPLTMAGHDFALDEIAEVVVERRANEMLRDVSLRLLHLVIRLKGGKTVPLLPGRDEQELQSIAGMLTRAVELHRGRYNCQTPPISMQPNRISRIDVSRRAK